MSDRAKLADQFLAHAALYQEAASKTWNETIAAELQKLAAQCREAAMELEATDQKPKPRLH